jgi:hypothetical protein
MNTIELIVAVSVGVTILIIGLVLADLIKIRNKSKESSE